MPTLPAPKELFFTGRTGDPRLGEWAVALNDLPEFPSHKNSFILFGCPDDEGVRLNRGRPGAQDGPNCIRKHFYKMALPMDGSWGKEFHFADAGNIVPLRDITETHAKAFETARDAAKTLSTVIALGGGHDFAAPNFLGFTEGRRAKNSRERFGLINIDPHLDVRELENGKPHSGTPFRQILDAGILKSNFVEFGARVSRNAESHYKYCQDKKISILTLEKLRRDRTKIDLLFSKALKRLALKADTLGVTFDLDACMEAEGMSAAPVVGFTAQEMCKFAYLAGAHPKVKYYEMAEVAPNLETHERSARIAAEMLYAFLSGRATILSRKK